MNHQLKTTALLAAFALCCVAGTRAQDQDEVEGMQAKKSFMRMLAGESGSVSFVTEQNEDGSPAWVRMGQSETGEPYVRAAGRLTLDSDKLYLESRTLDYDAATGTMRAEQQVVIRAEGLDASCETLTYVPDSGDVILEKTGTVSQKTTESTVQFEGMKNFKAYTTEAGWRSIVLEGPDPISVSVEASDQTETGEGFAGLGKSVAITTKPYKTTPPEVSAVLTSENALDRFEAKGEVTLQSTEFTILAEEIAYSDLDGLFEANGRVFMKNRNVEAECGRMVYNRNTGKVVLSILPEVRQREVDGITVISGYDSISYILHDEGTPEIEGEGSRGRIDFRSLSPDQNTSGESEPRQPADGVIIPVE